MTNTEIRQLENENAFLKRKLAAMEKKYGAFKGRSFLAIVAERKGKRWSGETIFVEDAADAVRVSNYLHDIENYLVARQKPVDAPA